MSFLTQPLTTAQATRGALYQGSLFKLAPTPESTALVDATWQAMQQLLGKEPRLAHAQLGDEEHFGRMGQLRRTLYLTRPFQRMALELLACLEQPAAQVAFDPLRLRCVTSGGHLNPRAKAVYYPHRDTWYGHPSTLITVWVALHDCSEEETFVFYPQAFDAPVPNDSEIFDYDEWVAQGNSLKIGWQQRNSGLEARYPGVLGQVEAGPALGFQCKRGEILLFSGAHFHRTLPHDLGRTRFSLDFRFVDLEDHAHGLGAPNVDNRSRGSALKEYTLPAELLEPVA